MKTLKSIAVAVAIATSLFTTDIFAQTPQNQEAKRPEIGKEWKAKMESARVAFITNELSLTTAEAQKFWPVYNEMNQKKDELLKKQGEAMKALDDAVKEGKGTAKLLEAFLKAQQEVADVNMEAAKAYEKVLPAEKVAKLFVIEENFRRSMIGRLNRGPQGGGMPGGPQGGPQMGGPRPEGMPGGQMGQKPENFQEGQRPAGRFGFPWWLGNRNQNDQKDQKDGAKGPAPETSAGQTTL